MFPLEEDLVKYQNIGVDDLYVELGKSLDFQEGLLSKPKKDIEYKFIGKKYFDEIKGELGELICTKITKEKIKKNEKEISLSLAVAEAISSFLVGVPLITITWLIVQIGIEKFCKENHGKK